MPFILKNHIMRIKIQSNQPVCLRINIIINRNRKSIYMNNLNTKLVSIFLQPVVVVVQHVVIRLYQPPFVSAEDAKRVVSVLVDAV